MSDLALLAEEVGVCERTLRRAINEGSLRANRPTPRKLELPLSERRYIRRSWGLISALRSALRTEQNVRLALLFGSAARGSDTQASDVDLLVQMRDPTLDRVVDLSAKLTRIVGRRVEVIRLEDAEAEPSFFADVAADGRVVVDREGLWPRLLRRDARLPRHGHLTQARRTRIALAGIDRLLGA